MYDIAIIGAGITGCSIARELSRYKLNICVIEKGSDVAVGTTKANSAIVHAGFDAKVGTLKAKLNAKGNSMFDKLSKELDFPFKRNGSLVLCFDKDSEYKLYELLEQGKENGVLGLKVIDYDEVKKMEPNVSDKVTKALYAPTGGIVCPYEMTIAYAENALENGVEFKFNLEVLNIEKIKEAFMIKTNNEDIEAKLIINAAGLFGDKINNMVSKNKMEIVPRKGEYCLFDKVAGNMVKHTMFQLPTEMGKGVLVTPTIDGNLLIGPNAIDIENKEDVSTTKYGLDEILNKARLTLKEVPMRYIITSFSGLRAHSKVDDFIIEKVSDVDNFINAAAIESPGLSSAPAIAEMVCDIVNSIINTEPKENFINERHGIPKFREMTNEERAEIISKNPSYGKIVCRCEMVTEGEILEAIKRPLGAKNLDGLKRRTRAGMGRCQSGFCTPKLVSILARELGIEMTDVTKFGGESKLLIGENKEI